jgi:glycosyltransferase involved in cell wall biosynthesis
MGVPNFFFSHTNRFDEQHFSLGYFGSYRSSGHLQGLEEMLKDLIGLFRADSGFRVFMSGIGEEGYKVLSELAKVLGIQQQLVLVKFLEHAKMPENMMNCNVLALPYPEGKYFASRFPIKAMEYASLKVPILCTSTTSHRNIFDESEVWFYDYNLSGSLLTTFLKIQTSPTIASEKADLAYAKSLNFSYSSRIEKIMGHLQASNR